MYSHKFRNRFARSRCHVFLPEPLLALLWCELIKGLGLLLSQKGFMVIVKVFVIIVVSDAEGFVWVNTFLLLCGFAGGIHHTESKAHHKWSQLHPVYVQTSRRGVIHKQTTKSYDYCAQTVHSDTNGVLHTRRTAL